MGGAEDNKGPGSGDKSDVEEVHKPLGLMRAILRIKAAAVQGVRGSSPYHFRLSVFYSMLY